MSLQLTWRIGRQIEGSQDIVHSNQEMKRTNLDCIIKTFIMETQETHYIVITDFHSQLLMQTMTIEMGILLKEVVQDFTRSLKQEVTSKESCSIRLLRSFLQIKIFFTLLPLKQICTSNSFILPIILTTSFLSSKDEHF